MRLRLGNEQIPSWLESYRLLCHYRNYPETKFLNYGGEEHSSTRMIAPCSDVLPYDLSYVERNMLYNAIDEHNLDQRDEAVR